MSKPLCTILYDNKFSTYYAGQTIKGDVVFKFNSTKRIRGIKIKFLGQANVRWSESETTKDSDGNDQTVSTDYTSNEQYFKKKYYLIGSDFGSPFELPAGEHRFPLEFHLPPTLPSSFEGDHGNIRYTIQLIIDRPWKFNHQYKFAFTVLDVYDLNLIPSLSSKVEKCESKTFCWLFCSGGPFFMTVRLPRAGFVPGQTIPIRVDCDNKSRENISHVTMKLIRKDEFYANTRTKTETKTIVSSWSRNGVEPGKSRNFTTELLIPPVPASDLQNCRIMDIKYFVRVKAKVEPCCSKSLEILVPVKIGTVPLYNHSSPQANINGESSHQPTISIFPTAPELSIQNDGIPSGVPYKASSPILDLPPYIPPPTYEESQQALRSLRDPGDDPYMSTQDHYLPKYPVFQFSSNS